MRSNVALTLAKNLGAKTQIIDQSAEFPLLVVGIPDPQQRRGMDGDHELALLVERQALPAQATGADGLSRKAARGGRAYPRGAQARGHPPSLGAAADQGF